MVNKTNKNIKDVEDIEDIDDVLDMEDTEEEEEAPKASGKASSKKIEVDKDLLSQLIASNNEMKKSIEMLERNASAKNGESMPTILRKAKESHLTMMKWNGKYFLGYENVGRPTKPLYVYNEYNPQTRENVSFVNVILEGEKDPIKLDYITFLREAERVTVKKTKQEEREEVVEQGMVFKKDFAENGYGQFETMVQVPVEIITKEYTFTVKLPEEDGGRELVIDSKWINN
jgi:hypothetical protein